jgi:Spy/CpxP family protein refolding chaperone
MTIFYLKFALVRIKAHYLPRPNEQLKIRTMKMLNAVLVGAALIIGAATATAQDQAKSKKTPIERAEMHTNKMAKELNLTEEQKAKVLELNIGIAQKNEAIRNDVNMTPALKKESLKGNQDARDVHMKSILTEEQYKLYLAKKAEMQEKKELKKEEIKKNKKAKKDSVAPATEELEEL